MSVVVAIKKDGIVYMGADSQVSRGGTRMTLSNPNNYKIWSLCDVDRSLMGSVGSLRTNNIIKVADVLLSVTINDKTTSITRQHHIIDMMLDVRVGDIVTFNVLRDGEEKSVSITITENCLTEY